MNRSNAPPDYEQISLELMNLAQKRDPADYERVVELLSLLNEKYSRKGSTVNEHTARQAGRDYVRMFPQEGA